MEFHSFNQIAQGFRFECGQMWITYFTAEIENEIDNKLINK